jgi:Asp-tRNA(Asn)/Glu-tRNA(Gln) amidotransferase A subunit family amidase
LLAAAYRLAEPAQGEVGTVAGLRIGICETPMWDQAEPDAQQALRQAAQRLAAAGAATVPLRLPESFAPINGQQDEIMQDGGRSAFLYEYLSMPALLHQDFKDKVDNHLRLTGQRMRDALDAVAMRRIDFEASMAGLDAVLTLSAPGEAPEGLRSQGLATFNRIWTALHVPCINLPVARGRHGLPIGLQLVHRRYEDDALLRVAARLAPVLGA